MQRKIAPAKLIRMLGEFDRSPTYRGLRKALQALIGDGRLACNLRLPSERALADTLNVSRTTVTRAYAELVAAGFAQSRKGSGTYTAIPLDRRRAQDRSVRPLSISGSMDAIDLNYAATGASPEVMAAYERALSLLPSYLTTDGYFSWGLPELQALIAESFDSRGLPTTAEQIVITPGALPAIAIVGRALTSAGDRILSESPVFANAVAALRLGGNEIVCSPLADPLGGSVWDFDNIAATVKQTAPRLAYLLPDFQNPTGHLMSDDERGRYAAILRDARCTPIIDEILQPTHLSGIAMPAPFAAHDPSAISIGSVSKIFWGGLRVGWIRAPLGLVEHIVSARIDVDMANSLFDQLVVAELLRAEGFLCTRRNDLRARRDLLVETLRTRLPDWRFRVPDGGLALWVQLPYGSATKFANAMEDSSVHLAPGPVFTIEGGCDAWLRVPYTLPEEQIVEAVNRMARTWHGESVRIESVRSSASQPAAFQ